MKLYSKTRKQYFAGFLPGRTGLPLWDHASKAEAYDLLSAHFMCATLRDHYGEETEVL